jgi:hypothetical protein
MYKYGYLTLQEERKSVLYPLVQDFLPENTTILDAFCGYAPLYDPCFDYHGFDSNPDAIAYLRNKCPQGNWYQINGDLFDENLNVHAYLHLGIVSAREKDADLKSEVDVDMRLIAKYAPKVVIIDMSLPYYQTKPHHWDDFIERIPAPYRLASQCQYSCDVKSIHGKRLLRVYATANLEIPECDPSPTARTRGSTQSPQSSVLTPPQPSPSSPNP